MKNFLDILTEISEMLKTNINVFSEGFAYCRKDDEKGLTVTVGKDAHYVSIADVEGDYFYIRANGKSNVTLGKSLSDCGIRVMDTKPCSIVAIVRDASSFALIDALMNELLKTKFITIRSTEDNPVVIMDEEFKGLKKETINKAKSRIDNRAIVRIDFEVTRPFDTHNCEYYICPPCN